MSGPADADSFMDSLPTPKGDTHPRSRADAKAVPNAGRLRAHLSFFVGADEAGPGLTPVLILPTIRA